MSFSGGTVVHMVANRVLPYPGGLQESVMRIGRSLAGSGYRVLVYTLQQPGGYRAPDPSHEGLTVVHLEDPEFLLQPYPPETHADLLSAERGRGTTLLLQNAIDHHRSGCPSARHVIVSFYASGTGFLAQMAATFLGIPHIASVRGTDFELDVFGTKQHPRLRAAIEGAAVVVTTNREQARALSALFTVRGSVRTIHNALPPGWDACWRGPSTIDPVGLISDCGFSGRKATHLLLRAAAGLIEGGAPISLTVLGGIFWLESQPYWKDLMRSYESRYPGKFSFPGHVDHQELERRLLASHIYCSASLAEGSSVSRIRALTLGIPMVATANGGLPEVAAGCRHVRLCRPGDEKSLAEALEATVSGVRAGTLLPDAECVARWREQFSVGRELDQWRSAIEAAWAT